MKWICDREIFPLKPAPYRRRGRENLAKPDPSSVIPAKERVKESRDLRIILAPSPSFPRRRESRRSIPNTPQTEFRRKILDSRLRGNDGSGARDFFTHSFAGMTKNKRQYPLPGAAGIIADVRAGSPRSQEFFTHSFAGMTGVGREIRFLGRPGVLAGMREAHSSKSAGAAGVMPGNAAGMRAGSPRSQGLARADAG